MKRLSFLFLGFVLFSAFAHGNLAEKKKYAVVLQPAEVRSGPSLKSPVLFVASPGQRFQVLGEAGGWVKVRLSDGREGYIWGSYLRVEVERVEVPAPKQPPAGAGLKPPPPSGSAPVVSRRHSLLPLYIAAGAAVAGGVGYFLFRKGGPLNRGKATLRISSSPSEAVVYIDGREKCETPCTVEGISPGTHTVKVERELYGKWEREMEFKGHEEYQVEAELSPFAYEPDFCFGSRGSGNGEFKWPLDLTLDGEQNIYVADTNNHRLQKFDLSGRFLAKHEVAPSAYPHGIRYSPYNGRLYVVFYNDITRSLHWYNLSFTWLGNNPLGLSVPQSVGVDSYGNVYIADAGNDRVVKSDQNGNLITYWTVEGTGSWPGDAEPGEGGKVYVSACHMDRVIVYSSSGTKEGEFPKQVDYPYGIAVDRVGQVYITSWGEHRVYKFLPDGTYVLGFGEGGSGQGNFKYPSGIAVDEEGKIYVTDSGNDRICIWRITERTITSPAARITVKRKKEGAFHRRGRKIQGASHSYGLRKPLRRIRK